MRLNKYTGYLSVFAVLGLAALFLMLQGTAGTKPADKPAKPTLDIALRQYQAINEQVKTNQNNAELIFIGDSITAQWQTTGLATWKAYYGNRKALNLGVYGDRTENVLWRLENGNLEGLNPKVAVLLIGTNNLYGVINTPDEIVKGVETIIKTLQQKIPGIQILLLGIFPRGENSTKYNPAIRLINAKLETLQDQAQVNFLNINEVFLSENGQIPAELFPDYLHLSSAGYERWARAMEPTLAELLQSG